MKIARNICRYILILTLFFSSYVKIIDPVGFSLKIQEYLEAFHLGFLVPTSLILAIVVSVLEATLCICLLMRVKLNLVSRITLWLMVFFTLLSLYLLIFNPIDDCGCFGEAIHLTNTQTFIKNLVLLMCAYVVKMQSDRYYRITNNVLEWVFMGFFTIVLTLSAIYDCLYSASIEFTDYKRGTSLIQDTMEEPYTSSFIYELDGIKKTFDIEHLPDDSWTYVETETIANPDYIAAPEFSVMDWDGNELTDDILAMDNAVVFGIYDPNKFDGWEEASIFGDFISDRGGSFIVIAGYRPDNIPDSFAYPVYIGDRKMLVSLNRSNGGVTFIKNGLICEKLSNKELEEEEYISDILEKDEDSIVIDGQIRVRLMTLGTTLIFIIILYIMKNVCRLTFRGTKKEAAKEPLP